ncbi:MAG: hypothetical protein ACTHJ0_16025 [Flavipsychrobacter sp.]
MKLTYLIIIAALFTNAALAQDKADNCKKKDKHYFSMGNGGIKYGKTYNTDSTKTKSDSSKEKDDAFDVHFGMLDLGFNSLNDKSNYNSPAAQSFLQVDPSLRNKNLFNLNQGKSINVNIYPIMTKYRLFKSKHEKLYLVSGLGLQLYNFRFDKPVQYVNNTQPAVTMSTVNLTKNKLAFDYLMIPLELVSKTKLGNKAWLVYGGGITGGYRLNSWMKQKSDEFGKHKDHDSFNFSDFNSCLMGEIGLDGYFRLYATYQITSLQSDALNQYPFCIGIRFMGI